MQTRWTLLVALIVAGMLLSPAQAVLAADEDPPQAQQQEQTVRGKVTAIEGNTLTLRTARGRAFVATDQETAFHVPGVENPSLEDIAVGDGIVAVGRRTRRILHARIVAVVDQDATSERVGGQVAAIEGPDITLNTRSGETVIVHTHDETVFHVPGVEEPGLSDVQVADLIGASGSWNEDGSLQADHVIVPREMDRRARVVGEVLTIEGDSLTLGLKGERQIVVLTDDETDFRVAGVESATLADVQVGDQVGVQLQTREGALYALTVVVLPEKVGAVGGEVTAIGASALTLQTEHGTVEVTVDAGTFFHVPGTEEATLDDLQVGDRVLCTGAWEEATSFRAVVVRVQPTSTTPGRPGAILGRAIDVGSDRLTVGTLRGPVSVLVGEETEIHVPGLESPSLADVQPGDGVGARGQWTAEGSLEAHALAVRGGGSTEPPLERP
jgi:hypothetical protein